VAAPAHSGGWGSALAPQVVAAALRLFSRDAFASLADQSRQFFVEELLIEFA
jgi:hypothetical protein